MRKQHGTNLSSSVLIITAALLFISSESTTHKHDVRFLKSLKTVIHPNSIPPGSCISSWNFSFDPCDSIFSQHFTCGFRCDLKNGRFLRLTDINLDPAGYNGSLYFINWTLPFLKTLDLSDNLFYGEISESISKLSSLWRLTLSGNMFSGEVPKALGLSLLQLQELYLDNNNFNGDIPSSFNSLINLKRLELQRNRFSGTLPVLNALTSLIFIDASDNELTGEITSMNLPGSLIQISIRNNSFRGNLTEKTIGDLNFVQVLDFSYNDFSGTIFSLLFNHTSLQQISLSHNNFTIIQNPNNRNETFSDTSKLIAIDLSYNRIRGLLPAFMAELPELSSLNLEHNRFSGVIPPEYVKRVAAERSYGTVSLTRLLLGGNYLVGLIPGQLMVLKPGFVNVSLVDNCLYRCPDFLFFCQGGYQKSFDDCKSFGVLVPP